jgi:predicted Zn-dependent peptidase
LTKRYTKGKKNLILLMSLDSTKNVASNLAEFIQLTGRISMINNFCQIFDSLNSTHIAKMAKKYFIIEKRREVSLKGSPK